MKKTTLKNAFMIANIIGFAVIIALSFQVNPAAAQSADQEPAMEQQTGPGDGTMAEKPNRPPRRKGGPLMRILDTDKDGILSADEIENAGTALKALDTNGDGNVTRDELPRKKGRRNKGNQKSKTENPN